MVAVPDLLISVPSSLWAVEPVIGVFNEIQNLQIWATYLVGNTQCGIFRDFSATQILREINFGHFEAPKTAILTIWVALNFEFLGNFDIIKFEIFLKMLKSKFKSFKIVKTAVFDPLKSAKIDFT